MLIDLNAAKLHLRLELAYPDDQITPYLGAAESKAMNFMGRKVFADAATLNAAVAAAPGALAAAGVEFAAAIATLDTQPESPARALLQGSAERVYQAAQTEARETLAGLIINAEIRAAILDIFAASYLRRGEAADASTSEYLLWSYRISLGV